MTCRRANAGYTISRGPLVSTIAVLGRAASAWLADMFARGDNNG
jgi:hypothetical protein